jgi:hypothetical protein
MARRIRVLDSTNRTMQRLGFLKPLCVLVNETETSNLTSLGKRLIERINKKVRLTTPVDDDIKEYARARLTDGIFRVLRKTILDGDPGKTVSLEIQDLYLADRTLPSGTGRLVEANWRRYPYLGTSLELIKKGTYSALTRSLVLLALTPKDEQLAFSEFTRQANPFRISESQALVLLYCLVDNDAEVLLPFFRGLLGLPGQSFDERTAGDLLPEILRQVVKDHSKRSVTAEERDRLALLTKTATSIEEWKGKAYTGGGARQEMATVRLEPYCDLYLFTKPDRERYEYATTESLKTFVDHWNDLPDPDGFLQQRFFSTFAACRKLDVRPADDHEATRALVKAGETLKSSLGYSPITDVGLLAGVRLLTEEGKVLELARTTELLKDLQKQDPTFVRFTVDRMGVMAYVKFLKAAPGVPS